MANTAKQTGRNILSVVTGVIIAAVLFSLALLVMLLTLASRVKGHGEETDPESTAEVFDLVSLLVIFACCFIGGFCTGLISTRKDMIHGLITGIVLTLLLAYSINFDRSTEAVIYYGVILPFTLAGSWVAILRKKKKSG